MISGLNITGTVYIDAPNVTLVDCKITAASYAVVQIAQGVTGVTVQNCEINGVGTGNDGSCGISGQGTFIGNNIYNVENGINLTGGNSVIQDNYIHGLKASGSPHYDGIQIDGGISNVTISHNTIINDYGQTSAIMIDNYWGAVSNITVTNNLLAGGGYTIYDDAHFNSSSISGVSFTNNHMASGMWGVTDFNGTSPTYTGNVNDGATLIATLNTAANSGTSTSSTSSGTTTTTTPPSAPVIASWSPDTGVVGDGITDVNTLTLKGTAAANSTVTVYDGSTKLGTATADSTGSWSYTTSVLTDATHALTATATTSSGSSAASAAVNVTVDTLAPNTPVLVGDSVVNTNQVQLSGTAEANSSIKVYDGTTVVGTATTNSSGAWSVTTSALSSGSHALTATATDAAGNVSAVSQALDPVIGSTTVATVPAAPSIATLVTDSGVAGDHITNDSTPTLSGAALANSTVNLFDGTTKVGTATADASGHWSLTTKALGDGTHSLTATDTTSAGTSAASGAFAVTIDTHAPGAPTLAAHAQDGTSVGSTTTVNDLVLQGTAEANSTVNVFDAGKQIGTVQTNGSGTWSYDTGVLSSGSHSFTANATDTAGNVSGTSSTLSETVTSSTSTSGSTSTTPDKVDFTNLTYNSSSDTATIKGTADAYSQVKVYDGTVVLGTVKASSNGTWSFTTKSLSDTLHTFTAQELDSHSNVVGTSSGEAILAGSQTSTMTGTGGNDFMYSGTSQQSDTFVFASDFGHSTIQGFSASGPGQDTIVLSKSVFSSFASVLSHASQVGSDVVIAAGNDTLTLKNLKIGALSSSDFHFA